LRIELHHEIPETSELRRLWNEIALKTEHPQVFYTYEWARAVQTAYRPSLEPLLFLGYERENLVGIASLARSAGDQELRFLAATTADYCDFLSPPELRAVFLDAVLLELQTCNTKSITLANLPADSATVEALRRSAGKHGFKIFSRPAYLCAQVELGTGEPRQALKGALVGKKKLRRYLREMEKVGPVTFSHLQSQEEIQQALPEFANAHVARFVATGRTSSLSTPERRVFLEQLARQFDGKQTVTLSLLNIQGRPVAWNFGFQFYRSWFWYQPTFDGKYEEHSPGHCLLSRIVVEACDKNEIDRVDLGLGAEGYKERFGNATRQTLHVTVSRSFWQHLKEIVRYRAAGTLKRSPKIESWVRQFLDSFRKERH